MSSPLAHIHCLRLLRAEASSLLSRWTFAPLLSTPFLFNSALTMGFMNFELGAGCAATGRCLVDIGRWPALGSTLILATLFSTGLYFVHFYCWAFYGLSAQLRIASDLAARTPSSRTSARGWRVCSKRVEAIPALALIICVARASVHSEPVFSGFKPPYLRISEFGI